MKHRHEFKAVEEALRFLEETADQSLFYVIFCLKGKGRNHRLAIKVNRGGLAWLLNNSSRFNRVVFERIDGDAYGVQLRIG